MDNLREHYIKLGHSPERLEKSPRYIFEIVLRSVIEIDNFTFGRKSDFTHTRELANILGKYQIRAVDCPVSSGFPYMTLWNGMRESSGKQINKVEEFALEMNLLKLELNDVPNNSGRLPELRSSLVGIGRKFISLGVPHNHFFYCYN